MSARAAPWVTTRALYVRGLGLVCVCAFLSFWDQAIALVGDGGILPARAFFTRVDDAIGLIGRVKVLSLYWLWPHDAMIHLLCGAGVLAGLAMLLLRPSALAVSAAYVCYLSLLPVGGRFLGYQWDILLVEALAASLLLVPFSPARAALRCGPPRVSLWVFRLLALRLHFASGFKKLASGDESWRGLSALDVHFQTQPLPNPLAFYAHHLPSTALHAATLAVLVIQIGCGLGVLGPRRVRHACVALLGLSQAIIAATGNFAFFNLLALVLLLPLVDDDALPAFFREGRAPAVLDGSPFGDRLRAGFAGLFLFLGALDVAAIARVDHLLPAPVIALENGFSPLHLAHGYGLFTSMTTARDEITLEATLDGETWEPYVFRYKPEPTATGLPQVAPHQPRLDWQMWFAALSDARFNDWIDGLLARLLDADPAVRALFLRVPFADRKPLGVRATLSHARFSTTDERARTGRVWVFAPAGMYAGPRFRRVGAP